VHAPHGIEHGPDFVRLHLRVFARQDCRAELMDYGEQAVIQLFLSQTFLIERHEIVDVTAQLFDGMLLLDPGTLLRVWVGQARFLLRCFSFQE
jgi:hypothetical protein